MLLEVKLMKPCKNSKNRKTLGRARVFGVGREYPGISVKMGKNMASTPCFAEQPIVPGCSECWPTKAEHHQFSQGRHLESTTFSLE